MTTKITEEQIQAAVRRYWAAMANQKPGELVKMYDYEATTFNPFTQRAELGQVAAARLEREYFKPFTQFHAEITSPIEVQFLADNVVVASHTYRSQAKKSGRPDSRQTLQPQRARRPRDACIHYRLRGQARARTPAFVRHLPHTAGAGDVKRVRYRPETRLWNSDVRIRRAASRTPQSPLRVAGSG